MSYYHYFYYVIEAQYIAPLRFQATLAVMLNQLNLGSIKYDKIVLIHFVRILSIKQQPLMGLGQWAQAKNKTHKAQLMLLICKRVGGFQYQCC